jgi:hypothetical protein
MSRNADRITPPRTLSKNFVQIQESQQSSAQAQHITKRKQKSVDEQSFLLVLQQQKLQ